MENNLPESCYAKFANIAELHELSLQKKLTA